MKAKTVMQRIAFTEILHSCCNCLPDKCPVRGERKAECSYAKHVADLFSITTFVGQHRSTMEDQITIAQEAFQAFVLRDYEKCSGIVGQVFPRTTLFLIQLMLNSLQRTGNERLVRLFREEHLPHLRKYQWEHALVLLTLGDIEPIKVAEMALNSEMRTEFHCYFGSRLLTLGQFDAAKDELCRCLEIQGSGVEKNLARVQLSWAEQANIQAPAAFVRQGSFRFRDLHKDGLLAEARAVAKATYELARAELHASEVDRLVVTNNFAWAEIDAGNFADAEALCNEAISLIAAGNIQKNYPISITYNLLANSQRRQGQRVDAIKGFESALSFRRRATGDEHLDLVHLYGFLGETLYENGETHRGECAFEAALHICRVQLPASNTLYLHISSIFSDLLAKHGNLQRAEAVLRQCLGPGPTCQEHITGYIQLATILDASQKPLEAQDVYRRVLSAVESHFDVRDKSYRTCLHQYGRSLMGSRDCRAAIDPLNRSIELFKADGRELGLDYALVLRDKAAALHKTGNSQQAASLAKEALTICTSVLPAGAPELRSILQLLGEIHLKLAAFASALPYLRQVADILKGEVGESSGPYGVAVTRLGQALIELQNHTEAETLYRRALQILQENGAAETVESVRVCSGLAVALAGVGKFQEAETCLKDALELQSRVGQHTDPERIVLILNLVNILQVTGAPGDGYLNELRTAARNCVTVSDESVNILIATGEILLKQGDYQAASGDLRRALEAGASIWPALSQSRIRAREALACALAGKEEIDEAIGLLTASEAERDTLMAQIFASLSENERTKYLKRAYTCLGAFLTLLIKKDKPAPEAVNLVWECSFRRKGAALDAMALQRRATPASEGKPQATLELSALRQKLNAMDLSGPSTQGEQNDHFLKQREDISKRIALLEEQEARRGADDFIAALKVSAADIRSSLPNNASLVEFVKFRTFTFGRDFDADRPERYAAFLVQPLEATQLVDLGPASLIDSLILRFRKANTPETVTLLEEQADPLVAGLDPTLELFRALADPILKRLEPRTDFLYIVADGSIGRVPFAALSNEQKIPVIEQFTVCYLTSSRDLFDKSTESAEPSCPIVIGNPDFDFGRSSDIPATPGVELFAALPGTLLEANLVASILGVEAWVGATVLKTRLQRECSPLVLHLGTHGFFLENPIAELWEDSGMTFAIAGEHTIGGRLIGTRIQSPLLRSGVALAGANTWLQFETPPPEAGNGILTAEDVTSMDLRGTGLVVLSACDTGLGDVRLGSGIFGLQRAFKIAGAKTIVMSMWKLDDLSTCLLMLLFYEEVIYSQTGCASALRKAQLALRNMTIGMIRKRCTSDCRFRSLGAEIGNQFFGLEDAVRPFANEIYWGGFVCLGNPGPILAQE
jgi:CHAT domain-containing protein/tetratricopeptide (TPR) repeat protein